MKVAVRIALAALLVIAGGLGTFWYVRTHDTYEVERTRVDPAKVEDLVKDDLLADKHPSFDPALADSRPFGPAANRWQINTSGAVFGLDLPDLRPDDPQDASLLVLHPSYAAAAKAITGSVILPSVNLIGGKAKQFDDGLFAALDLHLVANDEEGLRGIEVLVRQMLSECDPRGQAAAWLWAALEAGKFITPDEATREPAGAREYLRRFELDFAQSGVTGFYEWSAELGNTFRFLRFLQQNLGRRDALSESLLRALRKNPSCVEMYQRMLAFYSRLTNPLVGLNLLDLADNTDTVDALAQRRGTLARLHFLPFSSNKEARLFDRLYPQGIHAGADLMRDFIKAIRDGSLDLKPGPESGWYDYQVFTLEAFVLPERAPENEKLLLSRKYKLRLIEAFKAQVTKYRETHIRDALTAGAKASAPAEPEEALTPRLRVEPNPTFFLRLARSYAFLQKFLALEVQDLNQLRGARQNGWRDMPLGDELESMRLLFYGLHLVSCEDIGCHDQLLAGEVENADYARALADQWLQGWASDPDLAVDTRVAVPVFYNQGRSTRFWATLGVRAAPLSVRWETAPSWRPWPQTGQEPEAWQTVPAHRQQAGRYVILVDEFAEFDRPGSAALPRSELRKICDVARTRDQILAGLRK
ncbi:MAG: hypothetical protein IPP14_05055 [Planctomycetes bacterium]|nr:hypothetical protein [Planctomycetota bacterium]